MIARRKNPKNLFGLGSSVDRMIEANDGKTVTDCRLFVHGGCFLQGNLRGLSMPMVGGVKYSTQTFRYGFRRKTLG